MVVIVVLLALVLFALPERMSAYWTSVVTQVAIFSVVSLGLGLLIGRVGMVSLGQVAVLALGAWVGARLCFATGLPFPIVLLLTGLITMVLGTLVGLPALRLSGLYLALITLMLAGAITVVLTATNFPNGGDGFLGHVENDFGNPEVRRPSIAETDPAYFRYTVIVAVVMFLIALLHVRGQAGPRLGGDPPERAGRAGRRGEHHALQAVGVRARLVHDRRRGGLLAGDVGELFTYQFATSQNIVLLAVVLMGGVFSIWGAIVAGVLFKLLPALLDNWGLPADLLTILFGVGILQVLLTAPAGLVYQFPRDMRNLGRPDPAPVRARRSAKEGAS